jgi:hypothetical protein
VTSGNTGPVEIDVPRDRDGSFADAPSTMVLLERRKFQHYADGGWQS